MLLCKKELKKTFVEKEPGVLYWRRKPFYSKIDIKKPAGCLQKIGYVVITLKGKSYKRSKLIYFMHNGYTPKMVDHINRNKHDDRIENLREVDDSLNSKNRATWSVTGYKHIYRRKNKKCKQGFYYNFQIREKGELLQIKSSVDLYYLVLYRNVFALTYEHDLCVIDRLDDLEDNDNEY